MLFALRLIGMALAGIAGWHLGIALAGLGNGAVIGSDALRYVLVLTLAGAALGLILTPYATVLPLRWLWRTARSVAASDLVGATLGLIVGLLIATLASYPLSLLPSPLGRWLPFAIAVLFAWLGMALGALRKDEVFRTLRGSWGHVSQATEDVTARREILADTSAIVDGRIVEIRISGFLGRDVAVPQFVLEELQQIADSADPARRQRGRRGLDMLARLQREGPVEVVDVDFPDTRGVDSKLVRLARQRQSPILTTDYNLSRVASLQGVAVLNINDLANALRSVVVPGEELSIEIVQEGRERGQGIGYLDDGTMVVVEGGRRLVGSKVDVEVTRILPTAGGRIVFSRLKTGAGQGPEHDAAEPPVRGGLRVVPGHTVHEGD